MWEISGNGGFSEGNNEENLEGGISENGGFSEGKSVEKEG